MANLDVIVSQIRGIMRQFTSMEAIVIRRAVDKYGQPREDMVVGSAEAWWKSPSAGQLHSEDEKAERHNTDDTRAVYVICECGAQVNDAVVMDGKRYRIVNIEAHLGRDLWVLTENAAVRDWTEDLTAVFAVDDEYMLSEEHTGKGESYWLEDGNLHANHEKW